MALGVAFRAGVGGNKSEFRATSHKIMTAKVYKDGNKWEVEGRDINTGRPVTLKRFSTEAAAYDWLDRQRMRVRRIANKAKRAKVF